MISVSTLTQILINGLTAGSFYVLMALGFTLIFGILRLVNFAHGEFYMIGAFVTYYLISKFAVNYFFAIALSTVVVGIIGFAIEKALFAPLRGRELSMLMSALGLQITIQGLMAVWVGVDSYSITPPFTGILEFDFLYSILEGLFIKSKIIK
jgi:branched-chain amino acid transport system permease protein